MGKPLSVNAWRIAAICADGVPVSMMEETNAANPGHPNRFVATVRVDEIQTIKRVIVVFNPAEQMRTTAGAGMTLNRCGFVNDFQFFRMRRDLNFVTRHHADHGEQSTGGFQHLRATASVVKRDLRAHLNLHWVARAQGAKYHR